VKTYEVKVPIAGHAYVYVEADSEEEAITTAVSAAELQDLGGWEALRKFNMGNVCYCPQPWEAEAAEME
jgi:hypothetical protein